MRIRRLTLAGYKRLMLNNIQTLTITPTSQYQLILGTNGSGKSSVLKELTPLPANASDFIKGGYKVIEIEHNGCVYVLTSTFGKGGNRHSFKRDEDDDLNPGGTGAVQKELVRREFGWTQAISDLIMGTERFTDLSPTKRRDWITQIYEGNLDFAMGVFTTLKKRARNAEGALDHVQRRITSESNKLLNLQDVEGLERRSEELHRELYALMQERDPNAGRFYDIEQRLNQMVGELASVGRQIVEMDLTQPAGMHFTSLDHIEEKLNELKNRYNVTLGMLKHYQDEYAELENVMSAIKANGVDGVEALQEKLQHYQDERNRIASTLERFTVALEPHVAQMATNEAVGPLIDILNDLPDNTDRKFSRDRLKDARDAISNLRLTKDRTLNQRTRIEHRIEHMRQAKETNCPKCGYRWREGFSEQELAQCETGAETLTAKVKTITEEIEQLQDYVEASEAYIAQYGRYRALVNAHPRLQPLWDYLLENNCITDNPKGHTPIVFVWQRDIERNCQLANLDQEITHLKTAITAADQLGDTSLFDHRASGLVVSIEQANRDLDRLREESKVVTRYRDTAKRALLLHGRTQTLEKNIQEDMERLVGALRRTEIDGVIHQHQNQLSEVNRQLTEKTTLESIIRDLQESSVDLSLDHQALKLLADELSPVDGLIAENLTGFIQFLVDQMNDVINAIWTHPLQILPCGLESGELDYKFPVRFGKDGETADVYYTSDGQTDIINFAFKLVLMFCLNFTDYPLYLDEFDRRLDEQHRVNAMHYVKMLIEARRYTQLFMISHYASSHGSFANAQFCVLDSSNITVPQGYNQHVSMT